MAKQIPLSEARLYEHGVLSLTAAQRRAYLSEMRRIHPEAVPSGIGKTAEALKESAAAYFKVYPCLSCRVMDVNLDIEI